MTALPESLDLAERQVLVCGTSPQALHRDLLAKGAILTAAHTCPDAATISQADLVIDALTDPEQCQRLRTMARRERVPLWTLTPPAPAPELSQPVTSPAGTATARGEVYLVGGGPGAPDLLTTRALQLMAKADAVVYDRLLGSPLLDMIPERAERIYVGKKRSDHTLSQDQIGRLLVRLAKEGKRVLRLKGGDPFIFGRGGEELELLAAEGIPFEIAPGITAASGCASAAGIPLTHRDHAQTCVLVTGHSKDGRLLLDWSTLVGPNRTVVVYMGLAMIDQLMAGLIAHGAAPTMPVAVVDNGTRPDQQVITGTIADMANQVARAHLKGPAITIIGTVVTLRDKLREGGSSP